MSENYISTIAKEKIYPIIRCKDAEQTVEIAKALVEGGIKVLEINVENVSIYEAINEISKYATVCAGGIITSMQADYAFNTELTYELGVMKKYAVETLSKIDKDGNVISEDEVSIIESSIFFASQGRSIAEGDSERFAEYSRSYYS